MQRQQGLKEPPDHQRNGKEDASPTYPNRWAGRSTPEMANVTRYKTSKGETRYRVRYRKPDGTQTDKRGFRRKIDAENWAAEHVTIAKATNSYIDLASREGDGGSIVAVMDSREESQVQGKLHRLARKGVESSRGTHVGEPRARIRHTLRSAGMGGRVDGGRVKRHRGIARRRHPIRPVQTGSALTGS